MSKMRYEKYKKIFLFSFFILISGYCYSQQPSTGVKYDKKIKKDEVFKPENTQQKMEEKKDEDEKLAREPRTKLGKSRRIKKIERQEKKDYYAHHNRIQTQEVRYRMNKNEKKSEKQNHHKRPNIFKRIAKKLQFNKRKTKRA